MFYGLGTIIGAGVYVLVGKVAADAGMFAPVSFLLAGGLALLTALSYAELSARFPKSAGAALYVHEGLRSQRLAVVTGLLVVLTGVVSAAALSRGFAGYVQVFVTVPEYMPIMLLVLALGALAAWGILESVGAAVAITLIELGGLLFILAVAGDHLGDLPARWTELTPSADTMAWHGILSGIAVAFYAFIGFEDMVNVAEETRDPERTLPRAILLAITISGALYLLVALVAVLTLPVAELAATKAPLAEIYARATGKEPWLIGIVSLLSVTNGALIQIIMGSRLLYGMSRQGWMPACFGRVHARTRTPLLATGLITGLVLVLALWFPIVTLAKATSMILLCVFVLANLALIRVKRRAPVVAGVRSLPMWLPVTALIASAAFVVWQIVTALTA